MAKLDTYLDGELGSAEAEEVDRHLRECSECAAESVRRVQWKKAIKAVGNRYTPSRPAPFLTRPPAPSRVWWPTVAAALAAIVVLAGIAINQNKTRQVASNHIVSELVDLHVATLASAQPVDVVSTDRHTVKPWFAGKIPFTFDLPDLANTPFELVGGRMSYLAQSPGAELLLRIRKHHVSVFIFKANTVPANFDLKGVVNAESFHLETFERGGLRYFVIGDVAAEDIQSLADRLR